MLLQETVRGLILAAGLLVLGTPGICHEAVWTSKSMSRANSDAIMMAGDFGHGSQHGWQAHGRSDRSIDRFDPRGAEPGRAFEERQWRRLHDSAPFHRGDGDHWCRWQRGCSYQWNRSESRHDHWRARHEHRRDHRFERDRDDRNAHRGQDGRGREWWRESVSPALEQRREMFRQHHERWDAPSR